MVPRGRLLGLAITTLRVLALGSCAQPAAVDQSQVPEDVSLGLHPLSTITSDPPGAKVFVNGEARGKTPLETPLAAGERNEVKVELGGYFPATQSGSPNAREHLTFSFTLKSAARLQVTTTPPGARVLLGREQVLATTPGLAEPLELGQSELTILLAGHQPVRQVMTLPGGDSALEVTLKPGVKVAVTSTPSGAEVFVDGAWLGQTPLEAFVSPKGKHLVEVKKEPYAPATRTFASVTRPVSFVARLVDTERVAAVQAVARARARHDKVNDTLEKLQTKIEQMEFPPASLERQRVAMEQQMEKAVTALEQADAALKAIDEARPQPGPPPEQEE